MLIEIQDDFYEEILPLANALHISPSEYLKRQHDSRKKLKSVLLSEKDTFIQFVEEYKQILDDLFFLSNDALASLKEINSSQEMEQVFKKLNTLVGEDMSFITKLYMVYREEKEKTAPKESDVLVS